MIDCSQYSSLMNFLPQTSRESEEDEMKEEHNTKALHERSISTSEPPQSLRKER